jgi:histidine phosphotransfer protein HptB
VLLRWVRSERRDSPKATLREPVPAAALAAGRTDDIPPQHAADTVELDPSIPRSARVIELFARLVPELITSIEEAMRERDMEALRQRAHKLKGSCLSLGARRMADVCYAIERAAASGEIDDAGVAQLPALYSTVSRLLLAGVEGGPQSDARG